MLKFVTLFALVAVALAEPEADAQWMINRYNNWYGQQTVYPSYGQQTVYPSQRMVYQPRRVYTNVWNYPQTYYPQVAAARLWKREAEADSEADPQWMVNRYNNWYPQVYNQQWMRPAQYIKPAVSVVASNYRTAMPWANNWYNGYAQQYAAYPYANRLWKREAEADSEADPQWMVNRYQQVSNMYPSTAWNNGYLPTTWNKNIYSHVPTTYAGNWWTNYARLTGMTRPVGWTGNWY